MDPPSKSFGSSGAPAVPPDPVILPFKVDDVVLLRMHSSKETMNSSASGLSYDIAYEPEVVFAVMVLNGLSDYSY